MGNPDWLLINISEWKFVMVAGPYLVISLAVILIFLAALRLLTHGWHLRFHYPDVVSANLSIGGIGNVSIKPNHENVRIAYHAWVELSTRKAVIPFDEKHDVIVEVYDSWYVLFKHLRDLAKSIPAHKLRQCKETQNLVNLMIRVLNEGMRPHLTEWQSKFRHWYEHELSKGENRESPQEIQRQYPDYDKLLSDLERVNGGMIEYALLLKKIAYGKIETDA